ncbi:MAG TPA: ATP-binding protein [Ktedonobacteraceae bacterium]|jgi:signal transduction histidine kinase|nr:ATP-binding protein [Ktedonobacteraceae bacterium]
MDAHSEKIDPAFVSKINAALIDFAHLTQQSVLTPSHITARKLLERTLTFCAAQRGAIFLPTPSSSIDPQQRANIALPLKALFHPLALVEVDEHEAYTLLAQNMLEGTGTPQKISARSPWLLHRILVTPSPESLQDDVPEQVITAYSFHATAPTFAYLFLGWTAESMLAERDVPSVQEQALQLLSYLAEGIGAMLTNLLLSMRNQELQTAAEHASLREMELLKAELLGTVSHELRSPLASIKGYAATLLRHEQHISPEERHEFLIAIDNSSDRLTVVVDRLLEMSQLDTGSIQLEYAPVNIVQLVRDALIAAEEHMRRTHVQDTTEAFPQFVFQLRIEDSTGQPAITFPTPVADWRRLREVLDNLLENALLYSPDGGTVSVTLRPILVPDVLRQQQKDMVSVFADELPQQMIEICISDTGAGIPPEHVKTIFNRFHRVDTRLTRNVNGLGLGLAICKRIITLHNGIIWAESEFGRGSTFYLRLPLDARTSI